MKSTTIGSGGRKAPAKKRDDSETSSLREQRDQLLIENAALRLERDRYRAAIANLTYKEFEFTKAEVLAGIGKSPPLTDLIDELESSES